MAWDAPSFHIPVQVNQGQQIASMADRLMGAYDQGRAQRRQEDVLNARKSIASEPPQLNADGTPNYMGYAQRLLGAGDLQGASMFQNLAQTQEERAYRMSRDRIGDQRWGQQFAFQKQQAAQNRVPPGFKDNGDGTMSPIPGGPNDPSYLGNKAQATQTPPPGFTRTENGYAPVPGGPADPAYQGKVAGAKEAAKNSGGANPEAEGKFRKEIAARAQPFAVMRDAYGRILTTQDNAAGDIALIFSYMRMLDPGSVVREGEFATAQNAAGIPDQIRNMYNKAINGERLNPNQRSQFRSQAKAYYDRAEQDYRATENQFIAAATTYGFDPNRVIPQFPPLPSAAPAAPGSQKDQGRVTQGAPTPQPQQGVQEGATATNPQTGERIMFRNGQWVPYAQ